MSHHIVHVLTHGTKLALERRQLACVLPEAAPKSLPVDDIRAVIIAARGVSITPDALAAILDADALVLHCNARYKPCGISTSLSRTVNHAAFLGQVRATSRLHEQLWRHVLLRKIGNQAACLRKLETSSAYLENAAKGEHLHEGNCARHYWKKFFSSLGRHRYTRAQEDDSPGPNRLLNYGYAVISALCHRSLIVHGLIPQLGMHHRSRYKAYPLIYDFVEPFRPFVDWLMALHARETGYDLESWAKKIGSALTKHRIPYRSSQIKLMDAVDKAASSLARCYERSHAAELWFPAL